MTAKKFPQVLRDLEELERITEKKIQAVLGRKSAELVDLLQEQIDPMYRINAEIFEIAAMTEEERAELASHITRWANREEYLGNLLEEHLGYIAYLKALVGIKPDQRTGLDIGV
ncbi:hypothetical protein [Sulfobacillus harzensis]|uniref:FlgN protein n=1 Tax=Sulfobacillus harzensis TaxID=2729629 RepID=A0A7Y0L4T0_9FIRM|nr:hypothetical protein [Sulfobacillus harzensis]NMP23083.1 hypothetical protein [Sulfobacillus harzensis]